ncbi:MAG: DUF3857 and transglutaminase domain-containing protein [Candidatus Fermentibacteraceae bacterium]|nr:DUF3857 and transglutaminase domain-containing protein [Candidatus Fermentibacteraceae bacterium]
MFTAALILTLLNGSPDAVHLLHSVTVTFEEDGSIIEETVAVIVPLTGRGVQRFSTISVAFREGMEDLEVVQAEVVHWRGGRGRAEATVSTGPHRILSSTNRLESSLRETVVVVPGLEVGDTVKVDIVRRIHSLPLSDVYSYSFSPQLQDSVVRSVFRLYNQPQVELYSTETGSFWEFRNLSPLPSHILAVYHTHTVSIATGDPSRLSAEASAALDIPEHSQCSRLDEIVLECGSDPGRLRTWVAENINYTGADSGVWPGWSPRSPEETLTDGSGVCRDRAILLTWLLRKAGYQAYPALASTTGITPPLVDARTFDHMITVYRVPPDTGWTVLDPTPSGLPPGAGFSFGLRGCTYLPLIPGGADLHTIPLNGWNDTLKIDLTGELDLEEGIITGKIVASAHGVPLELITTLFTQTSLSSRSEMFRRFFGAVSCDSVSFNGVEVTVSGIWKVYRNDGMLLLPGLREISLHGSRSASMLLPCPPDSFVVDAPAVEILSVSISVPPFETLLPEPVDSSGYSCEMNYRYGRLVYTETADITNTNSDILETLLVRSGTSARTVRLL